MPSGLGRKTAENFLPKTDPAYLLAHWRERCGEDVLALLATGHKQPPLAKSATGSPCSKPTGDPPMPQAKWTDTTKVLRRTLVEYPSSANARLM